MGKNKNKIDPKHAKEQVKQLCEFYDVDMAYVPPDARESLESVLLQIEKAVARGRLEIKTTGDGGGCTPILHISDTETLTFAQLTGEAKVAMSKASSDSHDRAYHLLGYMCGQGPDVINELKGAMLSAAESLGMFFLQV